MKKITDNGPEPNVFDLETATKENPNYRTVAWTGKYLQVTLMSIPVAQSIGLEVHEDTDQFVRAVSKCFGVVEQLTLHRDGGVVVDDLRDQYPAVVAAHDEPLVGAALLALHRHAHRRHRVGGAGVPLQRGAAQGEQFRGDLSDLADTAVAGEDLHHIVADRAQE